MRVTFIAKETAISFVLFTLSIFRSHGSAISLSTAPVADHHHRSQHEKSSELSVPHLGNPPRPLPTAVYAVLGHQTPSTESLSKW